MNFARSVRGDDDDGRIVRHNRAEFGDRHLEIGEQFEQQRLKFLVGAINLVDEQHGRTTFYTRLQRLEQRSCLQKFAGESPARIASRPAPLASMSRKYNNWWA